MSRIEELINEKCPNGVKYYKLSEICEKFTGLSGKSKADFQTGNYRYITYTNIYNNPSVNLYANDFVSIKPNEKQNIIKFKDILIAGSSENLEDSGMISVVTSVPNEKIYLNSFCFGLRLTKKYFDLYNADFLKHLFRSKKIRSEIIKCSFGVTRYNLSKDKLLKIKIPCPPLEVQEEIVRILDKFSELEAELEAELEVRKKQYEFWGHRFFECNEYKKLFEVAEIKTGSSNTNQALKEGLYPFYTRSQEVYYLNEYEFDDESIITAGDGAGVGKSIHYVNEKYALHQRAYRICPNKDILLPKYLYYYMKFSFYDYIINTAVSSSVTSIRKKMLDEYIIPLPSIEHQTKIVNILDKFDKLINDISEGIPAEIEARRKQYEYYRNRLLSFEVMK